MMARIPAAARDLVRRHHEAGDICAIVTATTRFVAEPFARALGVEHLVATEWVLEGGVPTGEIDGLPCYREGKLTRVQGWLKERFGPAAGLPEVRRSWFYSDSASDLPLLQAVTDPVAVSPDDRLRAHAARAGWPVLDLGRGSVSEVRADHFR
jgi:HAD superfamily hydrolase (TIGR01490 family)